MKNLCISFLIIGIIILSAIGFILPQERVEEEYLRIHIRANSNLQVDQTVKYAVRDAVIEYLTPKVSECDTKAKAEQMLNGSLRDIEKRANEVLKTYGFSYESRAEVRQEEFPTRVYENLTLSSGFYDALIIELGEGVGDNWWCVVYPPLCFTGEGSGYVYRSKIADIINDFFKKEQ